MSEFTYESKCRRCGNITEWAFPGYETFEKRIQIEWQVEKMNYPSEGRCDKCEKHTIQDVVAFNRPDEEQIKQG